MATGILISYSGYPYSPSSFMPDNGLANLAGALLNNNHSVLLLDYSTVEIVNRLITKETNEELIRLLPVMQSTENFDKKDAIKDIFAKVELQREKVIYDIYEEIKKHINERNADFIGFKLWMGDGFVDSIKLAEYIKKDHPKIKLYAGGPQVQLFRETIYKKTQVFDAIAYAEGEEIISLLAEHSNNKKSLEEIPNIIYMDSGRIISNPIKRIENLDDIPYPVYDADVYPAMESGGKIKIFSIDESRGCPNSCAFCVHPAISGNKLRKKSVNRIIEEMKYIKKKHNSRAMRFTGSNTPTDLLVDLSVRLIEEDLDITYSAFSNLQGMSSEKIDLLKKSGLFGLFIGIESADKRILKKDFNKSIDIEKLKSTIKLLMDAGIFVVASFIYPAPSEDDLSRKNTLNFILDILNNPKKSSVTVQAPGIFPLSKWSQFPEKYGFELNSSEKYKYDLMTFNIKQYLPVSLWGKLEYSVNGKSFNEMIQNTTLFSKEIESSGILMQLLDEAAMMAFFIDCQPIDFKRELSTIIFSGDFEKLKEIINNINSKVA